MPADGHRPKPHPFTDASRGVRLQKVLAEAGIASRRACEQLIEQGKVRVNGQVVASLPAWVDPFTDRVEVVGHPIPKPRRPRADGKGHAGKVYVLLNKPRKTVATANDPQGRRGVLDLVELPGDLANLRLFPVGRLDADTSGLMLLTNDGEMANRLTHPRYAVTKQYLVSLKGQLDSLEIQRLKDNLFAQRALRPGQRLRLSVPPDQPKSHEQVKVLGRERDQTHGDHTSLLITLREGQRRDLRQALFDLGFKTRRLSRVAIGPITIKGLAVGTWRLLTGTEIKMLERAAGMAKPNPAAPPRRR